MLRIRNLAGGGRHEIEWSDMRATRQWPNLLGSFPRSWGGAWSYAPLGRVYRVTQEVGLGGHSLLEWSLC